MGDVPDYRNKSIAWYDVYSFGKTVNHTPGNTVDLFDYDGQGELATCWIRLYNITVLSAIRELSVVIDGNTVALEGINDVKFFRNKRSSGLIDIVYYNLDGSEMYIELAKSVFFNASISMSCGVDSGGTLSTYAYYYVNKSA
jgi:hypothetical protein